MSANDPPIPPAAPGDDLPTVPPLPEVTPYGFLQETAEQHATQARTVEEYIEELRTAARYRPWFEQYHPESVTEFIRHYALQKERALRYGESSTRWLQERITEYTDAAYQRLWDIQQKKLFDLSCRWRAGQLTLPGIDVSYDFADWSSRIYRCELVAPITPEEFDLYCQFVATTPDFADDGEGNEYAEWQEYEEYRREYADDDDHGLTMPEWYGFYNARCGTTLLLGLPDVRGPQEEHYLQVALAAEKPKREAARAAFAAERAANPPDPRPRLTYTEREEQVLEFARRFESGKVQRLFEAYQEANQNHQVSGLEEALETLQNAHDEVIEIEGHRDWREAVIRAAANYRRRRLLKALPVVYEEYQTRQQLGIAHPPLNDYESKFRVAKHFKKKILKARRLLGEPEDFDY